jgi:hypothetical protein
MALKRSLHPLDATSGIAPQHRERLHDASITTVEDFVGAADADPESMARVLHVALADVKRLRDAAFRRLNGQSSAAMSRRVPSFPLGALPPDEAPSGA